MATAVAYLETAESQVNVEDIRGIWVSSDDGGVVGRVKEIAPDYFPNVEVNAIFWADGGVEGGPEVNVVPTQSAYEARHRGKEAGHSQWSQDRREKQDTVAGYT